MRSGLRPKPVPSSLCARYSSIRRESTSRMDPVVVLPLHRFDFKPAVGGFEGAAVLKDHHTRHVVRSGGVGNVIALDIGGRLGQAEQAHQLIQRRRVPARDPRLLGDPLGGVAPAHLHKLRLLADLGLHDVHPGGPGPLPEPLLEQLAVFDLPVHRHLRRHPVADAVIPADELRPRFRRPFDVVEEEVLPVGQAPP